ncbi:hypothetical protein RvY_18064 [Ramazzottius varieornatus]|uniref:Uncharacterized protein n=1 Tax=Ramazzottius varieornatus TaxID=947166 RepID=A0A1D1W517_RAMVA|nr:hypothetical protein RvY_18064 [Ramazzottius varieornatus]
MTDLSLIGEFRETNTRQNRQSVTNFMLPATAPASLGDAARTDTVPEFYGAYCAAFFFQFSLRLRTAVPHCYRMVPQRYAVLYSASGSQCTVSQYAPN